MSQPKEARKMKRYALHIVIFSIYSTNDFFCMEIYENSARR